MHSRLGKKQHSASPVLLNVEFFWGRGDITNGHAWFYFFSIEIENCFVGHACSENG